MRRRKGWWQQLKDNDYPKTKTSYGQDIYALDPRLLDKIPRETKKIDVKKSKEKPPHLEPQSANKPIIPTSQEPREVYVLRCSSCGHKKLLTSEYLKYLRESLSIDISFLDIAPLREKLGRFKCSCCGEKNTQLISEHHKVDSTPT